jgi:hypothetical protein
MTAEQYNTVLIILGAIIAALLFVVARLSISLRDSLPPQAISILPAIMTLLQNLADRTATNADDDLVDAVGELLERVDLLEKKEEPAAG